MGGTIKINGARMGALGFTPAVQSPYLETTPTPYSVFAQQPGFIEAIPAAFRQENIIGSLLGYDKLALGAYEPQDPDWNPENKLDNAFEGGRDKYFDYLDLIRQADSPDELGRVISRVDAEIADKQVLSNAGGAGVAAMIIAGVADPINFIPIGGAIVRGGSVGRTVFNTMSVGFLASSASEITLAGLQKTRTAEEMAYGIVGGTVLSGVLGGVAGMLAKRSGVDQTIVAKQLKQQTNDMFDGVPELDATAKTAETVSGQDEPLQAELFPVQIDPSSPSTVGAVHAFDSTLENTALKGAFGLEKALSFSSPLLRVFNSGSVRARKTMSVLSTATYRFVSNASGTPMVRGGSVEDNAAIWYGNLGVVQENATKTFATFKKTNKGMSELQFFEQVGYAMRRGDRHEISEVAAVARKYREVLFNPFYQDAKKVGLLPADMPDDPVGATSYLSRIYNVEKIMAQRPDFEETIANSLLDNAQSKSIVASKIDGLLAKYDTAPDTVKPSIKAEIMEISKEWAGKSGEALRSATKDTWAKMARTMADFDIDAEIEYLPSLAQQITDNIMGVPGGRLSYDGVEGAGSVGFI